MLFVLHFLANFNSFIKKLQNGVRATVQDAFGNASGTLVATFKKDPKPQEVRPKPEKDNGTAREMADTLVEY